MELDKFESLPGMISELQDGGLQISEASAAPVVLILGTSNKGPSGRITQVVRAQESENQFGREGTLVKGMYESIAGGSTNTALYRINTLSAILYGVGTDDQSTNPTMIETMVKDGAAADLYLVRYQKPSTVGPNATTGRLRVKNSLGIIVYDNNPGGQPLDLGEVVVSGTFDGGDDIGSISNEDDYISFRELAQDETQIEGEVTGETYLLDTPEVSTFTCPIETALAGKYFEFSSPATDYYVWYDLDAGGAADPAPAGRTGIKVDVVTGDTAVGVATKTAAAIDLIADFSAAPSGADVTVTNVAPGDVTDLADVDAGISNIAITQGTANTTLTVALANDGVVEGSVVVYINGNEIATSAVTHNTAVNPDEITIASGLLEGGAVTVDYKYDANADYNLRDGRDGLNPSKMELYEALDEAYRALESEDVDVVVPKAAYLDDKNLADGATIVLSNNPATPVGSRYPVPGSTGDALGYVFREEYEGEFYYFWDTNDDGVAEIYPVGVGSASATTKLDGTALTAADFHEVNFAYQLANYCHSSSVNDNDVDGVIGVNAPFSYSSKDVSKWIGKEPELDADGNVIVNGSGLLGNKFRTGKIGRESGFYATGSGYLPTGLDFDLDTDILKDRNGRKIDIGKYLSITFMPVTFFNNTDETGFGYVANMSALYAGFYASLAENSAPTNKVVSNVRAPFKVSKTKLNALARYSYIGLKQKANVLRISDAPTAAGNDSDYRRLTTKRITSAVINSVRAVAEPYIGEPNTALTRVALETGITRELANLQSLGYIQRFEARVSATSAQEITGDNTVELSIVPAFELRKITIITSLAKQ